TRVRERLRCWLKARRHGLSEGERRLMTCWGRRGCRSVRVFPRVVRRTGLLDPHWNFRAFNAGLRYAVPPGGGLAAELRHHRPTRRPPSSFPTSVAKTAITTSRTPSFGDCIPGRLGLFSRCQWENQDATKQRCCHFHSCMSVV